MLTWRQLFQAMSCPFSFQIDWSVASCIMAMLIGVIDALSGDLHTYLSGRTSKFIMWCGCLWINIFFQVISSFFLLTYADHQTAHQWHQSGSPQHKQSIWIENGRSIARNNCLQVSKLPYLEVTEKWKLWHYISPLLIPTHNLLQWINYV